MNDFSRGDPRVGNLDRASTTERVSLGMHTIFIANIVQKPRMKTLEAHTQKKPLSQAVYTQILQATESLGGLGNEVKTAVGLVLGSQTSTTVGYTY